MANLTDLARPTAGDFFDGGNMGALMRSLDWSATPLGAAEGWPQSLRTAVSICLLSRFPMIIFWGPELVQLYNDDYRPILAAKHPASLGQRAQDCWPEIWGVIGPMLRGVLERGEPTWSDDQLLLIDREGYVEECYFTWSYSPIRDESGGVGGVFCAVTETTKQVVGARRLRTLRDLAAQGTGTADVLAACQTATAVLAANPYDIPFAALYLVDEDGTSASLAGTAGIEPTLPACPAHPDLTGIADSAGWPLAEVARTGAAKQVSDLATRFPGLPSGGWPDPPETALVLPVTLPGHELPRALLVAATSPRRALDDDYRSFFDLVTCQVAAALADALAYAEERRRAEALAELDRAKTTFFANVSHELRTPLTLLLGPLADALAEPADRLPPETRRHVEMAHRNGLRLQRLVNALLDFSRIEAGRIRATYEPTDLAILTAELASSFRSAVEAAGLAHVVECPPLGEPVYVDREMWEKVVLNLLSNAFKFTFEGEIRIGLRRVGAQVELAVTDTGIGIPDDELPHLFERFHRVRSARARTHEGSGIGLALVQELVKLHGGTVRVSSEVGRGTCFTVTIPTGLAHLPVDRIGRTAAPGPAGAAAAYVEEALRWLPDADLPGVEPPGAGVRTNSPLLTAPSPVSEGAPRRHVLVADDNADMRAYLRHLLAPRWEVIGVPDGQSALTAARERRPDLVLADVMMPGLDGFELLRELRADSATAAIPIILLSARAGEESRVEGLAAGADDYLTKPFSARELLARIEAHLKLAELRAEISGRERAAREAAEAALRARDEFLSIAAHELRTPLTTVRAHAQLLVRRVERDGSPVPVQTVRSLRAIARQSERLASLIDQLLDISRIEAGKLALDRTETDLRELVEGCIEAARAKSERHEIVLHGPPGLPALVDPVRLEQVIANLLDNAIKYSPGGERIEIGLARATDGAVELSVRDGGIGIPTERRAGIFDRFYQAHGEGHRGGMGLGLYISRQIVELHGGEIAVEFPEPGGTQFVVRLPAGTA